jgi:hypothetical protein
MKTKAHKWRRRERRSYPFGTYLEKAAVPGFASRYNDSLRVYQDPTLLFDGFQRSDFGRREQNLTLFTCPAIAILALATALPMYPIVFSHEVSPAGEDLCMAFLGFPTPAPLLLTFGMVR